MSWKKVLKNSDGSYDIFDWNLGMSFGVGFTHILTLILMATIINLLIPIWGFFFHMLSFARARFEQVVISIIGCIYWFVDYKFGFISWHILRRTPEIYDWLNTYMAVSLIIFVLYLLFDRYIVAFYRSTSFVVSLIAPLVVGYLLFPIVAEILPKLITMHVATQ